jgi:aminopeptidase N
MSMPIRRAFSILAVVLAAGQLAAAVGLENICRYCGRDHSAAAAAAGESTRKYAPDRKVDVQHIKIDVTPDFEKRTIAGTTTLTFAPISKPVDELTLDAEMLRISKVDSSLPLADFVATDHHLTLLFAEPIPVGKQTQVSITYTAEPQKGLYFRTPELGYPEEDTHIWTQGETHEAPHWFPCFDYPNERSTTEVVCTVPEGMVVISNGKQVEETIRSAGTKTVRWLQDKPHVSYLVCLVAGKFHKLEDKHRDVPLGFYAQPSLAEHAANSFADTKAIMAFYESEIGVAYPWDKYDQATIRDFNSGGMENTTITTLYHGTIFSKETENIRSSRNLDAHEMAHQWFGDYVTCEDWAHLWLNEGFATYYTHLYNEHKLGRDELLYGLWQDAVGEVLPKADDTKPIVFREYANAWEQFDYRAYPKGSWVLHMLRSQLGVDLYQHGIKRYLENNALSSVVTADLVAALEEVSGRELDQFFDQWVFGAGSPTLKVRYKWLPKEKFAHVTVEQTQKIDADTRLFQFPTVLRFTIDGHVVDHAIEINKAKHDFYVPLQGQPELVRFDPQYTVLAEVDFDKPQQMLEAQLAIADDVIGRLLAAKALGKKESQKSIAALQQALSSDAFYGVRIAAANALEEMGSDEAYAALAESTTQSDARVRNAVVGNIGKFYRPEALEQLKQVVDDEPNPAIVATAVRALSKYAADEARGRVEAALDRPSFGNEIAGAAIEALGNSGDTELRGRLLNTLKADRHEFSDRDYAKGLTVLAKLWSDADDKAPVRAYLEQCLRDPARRVRGGAIDALGELGDPQAVPALESFAEREGRGREATAAASAVKKLQDDAPFVPREVRELRKLVSELRKEHETLRKEIDAIKGKAEARNEAVTQEVSAKADAS